MRKALIWVAVVLIVLVGGSYAIAGYAIHQARGPILARLNDPGSAVFRNEKFHGGILSGVLCGEVNAKNRMGGYAGNAKFFSVVLKLEPVEFLSEIATDELSSDHVNDVCAKAESTG